MSDHDALDAMDSLTEACAHARGIAGLLAAADLKEVPNQTVALAATAMLKHIETAEAAAERLHRFAQQQEATA